MAPKMLHLQLRKGFFKEGGVRKMSWRQKFHFSSCLSFPRRLSAVFSVTNLEMAKTPPVMWPPVLGHRAAIRTAPNFSWAGLGLTQWLCSCVSLLNHTRKSSRASQTSLLQTTLDGLCCTPQGDCKEHPPLCHLGACPEPPTLLSCSSSSCHPSPSLTWNDNQNKLSVAFIAHSPRADGPVTLVVRGLNSSVGGACCGWVSGHNTHHLALRSSNQELETAERIPEIWHVHLEKQHSCNKAQELEKGKRNFTPGAIYCEYYALLVTCRS